MIPWKRQMGKHAPRWMNKRMQKCIRRKRKKWKKFKDTEPQEDYTLIQSQTTLSKQLKRDLEKKPAKNIKKDIKYFCAYYREKNISRVGFGPLEDANDSQ